MPPSLDSSAFDRLRRSSAAEVDVADLIDGLRRLSPPPPPADVRTIAGAPGWRLERCRLDPGVSRPLHAHATPVAWRVVGGHLLETAIGGPDRTWAVGEVGGVEPRRVHQLYNPGPGPATYLRLAREEPPRAPPSAPSRRVVVVGGGVSAAALTIHLARRAGRPVEVTVVERAGGLGRGIAYGVASPAFRLNVPASRMSLDPERPADFVEWAGAGDAPDAFLSRARYGAYVEDRLADALARGRARATVLRAEASAIRTHEVVLADGRTLTADRVVLATGLVPRRAAAIADDPRIVDAWDEPALHVLPDDGRFLVLGSGLSAIDVLGVLEGRRFRGRIVVVSRRGLLPRPHLAAPRPPTPIDPEVLAGHPTSLGPLVAWVRGLVRDRVALGEPWQLALDALRPHVPRLWRALSHADRARFVRTVRPYWEVLRHRAPVDALAIVDRWRAEGRFELRAARLAGCRPRPDGIEVELAHGGATSTERFDAIVRCIGPALEHGEGESPLIADLLARGVGARDPAGLGLVTDADGRVVAPDGRAVEWLFALGALRRAASWETTAVPEIARQAQALAALLLAG